jgi:Sec-independent protein secretion pathway component TatC
MKNNKDSMPFLDHLEELRWRLIKSIASILIGAVVSFYFIDIIIEFLIKPTEGLRNSMDLQVLKVQGMFMIKWGNCIIRGHYCVYSSINVSTLAVYCSWIIYRWKKTIPFL